ncbi:hypothetical protein Slin14017_G117950 [Septoria linicola]|nr:hypothetical protein Slin14017_G117950 [Septoria linicola]
MDRFPLQHACWLPGVHTFPVCSSSNETSWNYPSFERAIGLDADFVSVQEIASEHEVLPYVMLVSRNSMKSQIWDLASTQDSPEAQWTTYMVHAKNLSKLA